MEVSAPPLLNTARLKPFRQRINRTVMTITDSGYVSMEIMCRHGNLPDSQEVAREVFHISPDGRTVEVYQHPDGVAVIDGCPVPGQPYKVYAYPELPVKQMKKYQHTYKFVELVKSRTPKVVLVTDTAHCKLMENSVPADFKADFNNGSTVLISKSTVTMTDKDGGSLACDAQSVSQLISPDTLALVQHTQLCHHKCLEIETSVSSIQASDVSQDLFPVTVGSTRTPYQIQHDPQAYRGTVESQGCATGGLSLSAHAQSSHTKTEAWLREGLSNEVKDESAFHCREMSESICSETELRDLMAGQFTEFGGSSRGSSVKSSSRSATPQKRHSFTQCGQTDGLLMQVAGQQYPASALPVVGSSNDSTSIGTGFKQPYVHSSVPDTSNEQYDMLQLSHQHQVHITTVPSPTQHVAQATDMNTSEAMFSHTSSLPQETFRLQPEAGGLLDSSIGSQSLISAEQLGFFTPKRNTPHHRQQQQHLDHLHSLSVDSWRRYHQLHHQHDRARLLMEHRRNFVQETSHDDASCARVKRELFCDLDLDLSLPVPSPVPSSGAHSLRQDLLAIQRNPSLNLSDCSDVPDAHNGASNQPVTTRQPTVSSFSNSSQAFTQTASDNLAEEFNTSVSMPTDISASTFSKSDDAAASVGDSMTSHSLPALEQATQHKLGFTETQSTGGEVGSLAAASPTKCSHMTFNRQLSSNEDSPMKAYIPKAQTYAASPQKHSHLSLNSPVISQKNFHTPAPTMTPKKEPTKSRLSLGLTKSNSNFRDNRRGSANNFYAVGSVAACSNNSSSNSSSNTSGCLDLPSPQSLPVPQLPAQLRHSLDMSASSHYSDSSAPSSSGTGDVVRQLFVPYTGWASLHATGAVWILYNDGTQVGIKSTEPAMIYVDQDGSETRYNNTDVVPEIVKMKLERLPSIVDQLMKTPSLTPGQATN